MSSASKSKKPPVTGLPDARRVFSEKGKQEKTVTGSKGPGVVLEVDGCKFTLRKGVETPCWAGHSDPIDIKIVDFGEEIQLGTNEAVMVVKNHAEELRNPFDIDEPESRLIEALNRLIAKGVSSSIEPDLEIISEQSPHDGVRELARKLLNTSVQ